MADLWNHLLIKNETNYTLTGHYSAKHGEGVTILPIGPRTTSPVITTKDETFAAAGSEGTFSFTLDGVFDEKKDARLTFKASCSYSLNGNYFEVTEVSPFLRLNLRFANAKPQRYDPNWGSTSVPKGGHPLGIQMRITQQDPVEQFSLLTYNTHLFEGSNAALVQSSIVAHDTARRQALVSQINLLRPDIVCLQEVWARKWQEQLEKELRKIYPYVYIVPDETPDSNWMTYLGDKLKDAVTNTSGLMVASKFRIRDPKYSIYPNMSYPDSLSKKSALAFSIRYPVSKTKCANTHIGTTHCPTDISEAQAAVLTLRALAERDKDDDTILAGDFNLHKRNNDEYLKLNLNLDGYSDVVENFLPAMEDSYTDWPGGNRLSVILKFQDGEREISISEKDRIDYIYFRPGSKNNYLAPVKADVFHHWKVKVQGSPLDVDVSDHYPVLATYKVLKAVPTIKWNPVDIFYGTPLGNKQLNASATIKEYGREVVLAGQFIYNPPAGSLLPAGQQNLEVSFTPNDKANYSPTSATVKINVKKATPTITWPTPEAIVHGIPLGNKQLNASATIKRDGREVVLPGQFIYNPPAGSLLPAGQQNLEVRFTPNDQANYSPTSATVKINVKKATPTITWPTPEAIVQGTPIGKTQLNAFATAEVDGRQVEVEGDYSYFLNDKPIASGNQLPAGQHTLRVKFEPNGTGNFEGATGSVQLRVWLATHVFSKYEAGNEETFSHLALKHYGHATPYYWQWIIDHNKGIIPENYKLTRAGTKVFIPEAPPGEPK